MNKKIIALVISVLYLMTSFVSFAETEEAVLINDVDYSKELSLINAVNPDYTLPEEVSQFTRSQFVKLLIDVMCPQAVVETETGFDDVDPESEVASSLKFAKECDIISPAQSFNPDENVTYTQAIKMVVTALGYKPLADAKGAYPTGYLTIANDLDLFEDLSASGDIALTIADGLKLICNTFDSVVLEQTGFGDDFVYDAEAGKSFLYYYHKIETIYGIVNATEYTSLTDSANGLGEGYIKIGISDYKTENDFSNLLGYNVKAYIINEDEVLYAYKYETEEIVINTKDIDRVDGFNVVIIDGEKEKKYALDNAFSFVRNGKAVSITSSDFNSYFKFDTGVVTLVDNNGDKKYDVAVSTKYSYSFVSKISLGTESVIYDSNSSSNSIVIDSDVKYKVSFPEDYGITNPDLKDISSGMLLAYTVSDDKKLYDITVCDIVIDGKITALDTANNIMYINDVAYDVSQYYTTYYSHIALGTEASFAVGIDGKVAAVAASGESYMKYGIFVGFSTPTGFGDTKLKIFSQTGEMNILKLADKVLIDNVTTSASDAKALMESLADAKRLIKFSANADGELKRVDTYLDAAGNELELASKNLNDSLTKFGTGNYRYKSGSGIMVSSTKDTFSFHIEPTTVNFIAPSSEDERFDDSKYAVVSTSYFVSDQTYSSVSVFDVNKLGCASATLIFGSNRGDGAGLSNYTGTAVIEKITTGFNRQGENALVVYVWKGNKYDIYYSDPELTYDYISILNPGDLVRFVADSDNVIMAITRDFNAETFEMVTGYDSVASILEYITGISYSASDKYMNILTNPQITPTGPKMPESYTIDNIRNIGISSTSVVYVDLVKNTDGTVVSALPRMSEISEIKSWLDSGDRANFVVARQYILGPQLTVIYNIIVK